MWVSVRAAKICALKGMNSPAKLSRAGYRYKTELSRDCYIVEAPDALAPVGEGAHKSMRYSSCNFTAAVEYSGRYKTFVMGFPFETIHGEEERDRLMRDILNFLGQ